MDCAASKILKSAANEGQLIIRKLVPFFITVVLYFVLLIPYGNSSILAVIIKCSPIFSLMYFVLSVGSQKRAAYSYRILTGLIFCSLGDAFLLWSKYFVYGMVAFMAGHVQYTLAFGFKPLKFFLGLILSFFGGLAIAILYEGLSGVLLIGVPIYILAILTMVWRATARIQKPWSWIQFSVCIGSILFAASDFIIGLNTFVRPIAHSQVLIMSSYYAAQLGISLSVLEIPRI